MNRQFAMVGASCLLLLAIGGGVAWRGLSTSQAEVESAADDGDGERLPVPPVPPRIAEGPDYERCLNMLVPDPAGAASFAETWQAKGGGDGATHCLALSKIALGNPADGAAMLETLAASSHAPNLARATLYGQATQAWLMTGDEQHAFDAATQALALSPDDADLLIDRATAASNLDRYQDAIGDLTHALDTDPRRADALTLRGAAWRHIGELDHAQDDIDRALTLDPDNADALLERGIIRQRHNDRAGARTDWERAVKLAPDTPTADLAQQNLALLEAGPDQR
ncbi:MAG TPA: tetratricopeptide repeat protein [Acetobacteraceae bacterium]|jgi:tetratricopeptide (TPR) repeat protein